MFPRGYNLDEIIEARESEQANIIFNTLGERLDWVDLNLYDSAINVKHFGAIGDGISDDTQAFINMFNYIATNYLTACVKIVVPQGVYKITQSILIEKFANKFFDCIGKLLFIGCNAFEFRYLVNSKLNINNTEGNIAVYDGITYANLVYSGFKFVNCSYNNMYFTKIAGFRQAIWLHGIQNGYISGVYYNSIYFQNITKCYEGLVSTSDELNGWVNENTFTGGGLDVVNGIRQGDVVNNGSGNFHNQKYINIGFEQIRGGISILFNEARSCVVLYPRFEGNNMYSLIIKELSNAKGNKYITANYTLEKAMVSLNLNGDSIVEADIRLNTDKIATRIKCVGGKLVYDSDYYNPSVLANTIINEYNDLNLFTIKTNSGLKKSLLFYEEPIYVDDVNLANSFANFTSNVASAYSRFHYYRTGNNELVVGGFIKGGAKDAIIYTFPGAYRPKLARHSFPITMFYAAADSPGITSGIVEIADGSIILRTEPVGTTRICLDGIRFSLNL